MDISENFDELLEEVIEETNNEQEKEEKLAEELEENLDELLEEEDIDYDEDDYIEEEDGFIPQTIDINDEIKFDSIKLDEYLKATYSFKETQEKTFLEYKREEMEKEDIRTLKSIYDNGYTLKGFDTFDDFLQYKRNNHIFYITVGLPFEKVLFDIEPKVFICKSFTSSDYLKMLKEFPEADVDFKMFNKYLIASCVLYPHINEEEVEEMELGIQDVLIPALMKHSRMNTNYEIKRL